MGFLLALGASAILSPVGSRLGVAVGLVDRPGDGLKIHRRPISLLGGPAVVAAALGVPVVIGDPPSVWIVAGVLICLALGVVDDAWPLPSSVRLLVQAGAGGVLVAGGLSIGTGLLGAILVIGLVLGCTNAVNMLDGQDGLAGGLAALAALGLAAIAGSSGLGPVLSTALPLAGALLGFLPWNSPSARVFLGNGGAYAVGTLLAIPAAVVADELGWRGLSAAALCLGIFAFESVFTVIRRVWASRPITLGDRLHSYDAMALRMGGRTRTTMAYWALGALYAGLGFAAAVAPTAFSIAAAAVGFAGAMFMGRWLWPQVRPQR